MHICIDIFSGDSVQLSATVFDDNIQSVKFDVKSPDGRATGFQNIGTLASTLGDMTTWTFGVDTSAQKGTYGFRVEMRDASGNIVIFPDTSILVEGGRHGGGGGGGGGGTREWIEFLVVDTVEQLVDAARDEIAQVIQDFDGNLAAKFVRMGFHDCVGGCDG